MIPLRTRIQRYAIALIAILIVTPITVFTLIHNNDQLDRAAYQRVGIKHLRAMNVIAEMKTALHTAQLQALAGHSPALEPFVGGLQRNLQSLSALESEEPNGVRHQLCTRIRQDLERAIAHERSGSSELQEQHFTLLTTQLAQLFELHSVNAQQDMALLPEHTLRQRQKMWLMVAMMVSLAFIAIWRIVKLMRNSIDKQASIERALHDSRERIHQMQKVEALGQLVGGVAHDFNNLMTAILGNAQLLLLDKNLDGTHRRGIDQIENAAERATKLTRQLLTFSRRQIRAPAVVQFNSLLEEMMPRLIAALATDVSITCDIANDAAAVRIDPSQLETVVRELLNNAVDACAAKGSIRLVTRIESVTDTHPHANILGPGRYCHLHIADTGGGMGEAIRARVFEPFFSGSELPARKGLGLAAVHSIVQSNDGYIVLESGVGTGTQVDLWLPLADSAVVHAAQPIEAVTGTETILVVDDEAPIRELLETGLSQLGYQVIGAASPAEALAICQSHANPLQLLICDVVMPNLNGAQLARQIVSLRPQIAVLLMSGYADDVLAADGHHVQDYALIDKPFQFDELAGLVRRTLDDSNRAR